MAGHRLVILRLSTSEMTITTAGTTFGGKDARSTSTRDLRAHYRNLSRDERLQLIATVERVLTAQRFAPHDRRIAAVRALVALLPDTASVVQAILARSDRAGAEVAFTLLCYLDDVQYLPGLQTFAATIRS